MSKGDFEQTEIDLGYTHNEHNILLDTTLDVKAASCAHVDWFHTYIQIGVFN